MEKDYNIGLDIGTTSVGWAVVETNTQKIIRKGKSNHRKALWGVRLFEEATTAAARRSFRSSRRRYDRRRQRIKLLQEEFKNEMNKVDSDFFRKLVKSKYCEEDKTNKSIILSADEKRQVKEYNDKYKTIYHLRNRLISDSSKEDIRLVYLALHHIIKYRGNFIYSGDNFNIDSLNLSEYLTGVIESLINYIPLFNIPNNYREIIDYKEFESIVLLPSKNDIKVKIKDFFKNIIDNKNLGSELGKLLTGNKFSVKKLLLLEELENDISISFSEANYDEKYEELSQALGDKIEIIDTLKQLYDAIFLKKLFKGSDNASISDLMVKRYKAHKEDLKFLKQLFDKNRNLYNKLLRTKKELCLYDQYIHNKINYEDFIKELVKLVESLFDTLEDNELKEKWLIEIKPRIDSGDFLPRITDTDNGRYPYQLNLKELNAILENQGKYYPFLLEKVNNKYKIQKILEFKIPYYVGPLVSEDKSNFAWMERKVNNVKITPYNFDEIVDKASTAEKFIERMISHCTYLLNEYALPNNSILYSRFKVMNELKQIKVNDRKLEIDLQHKIIEDLFIKTSGTITDKKFKLYLYTLPDLDMYKGDINITGYSADMKFANNMQSYVDFFGENGIFNNTSYSEENAEEIIKWITIFEDKDILEEKVRSKYTELDDEQIKRIVLKRYSGWGKLSRKLLKELTIKDKESELPKSIIQLMYETEDNFMQIINKDEYGFQELIKSNNIYLETTRVNYKLVENLATSPATKKGIYQALKVVEEIIDYMGHEPKNIMIEMARAEEQVKARKDDRKKQLLKLYEKIKETQGELEVSNLRKVSEELKSIEKIDSQKLFLYFIQEGKCLYSGKPLNIEDLNEYEIDHILPRTLIKDDSIDNKALVYRECNQKKADSFVLPENYRTTYMINWWRHLKKNGLISASKFYRLTRKEYNDEDIQGFINRQLIETRQITKHVSNILSNLYKNTKIIYLKANLSHNYRERYELFKFREINDYHHAHDAYLAAVLGEYKEKYMKKNYNFEMVKEMNHRLRSLGNYRQLNYGFVINSLDENVSDIILELSKNLIDEETGEVLFDARKFNERVENTLYRNDILISRKTEIRSGQLFKQTIYSKGIGNIQLKKNMPTKLYGGYLNVETAYLVLVKYKKKKKLIAIPLEIALKSEHSNEIKIEFIKKHLNVDNVEIIKDFIPFETLIDYKSQVVYVKGYGVANKVCEVSNAFQLKMPFLHTKRWKYVLNKVLNKGSIPVVNTKPILSEEEILNVMKEIITYLYEQKSNYPLFENEICKIEKQLILNEMNYEELAKAIIELLKIYHCNSVNGNLKEFGLGDRIGRLSGKNIDKGIIITKSITGIKERRYEF